MEGGKQTFVYGDKYSERDEYETGRETDRNGYRRTETDTEGQRRIQGIETDTEGQRVRDGYRMTKQDTEGQTDAKRDNDECRGIETDTEKHGRL